LKRWLALLILPAVALFAGCDLVALRHAYNNAVYVMGDSITSLSAGQTVADLHAAGHADVIMQDYPGVSALQAFPWLVGQGPSVAPNIVVALGTNDGAVPAPFGPQIDQYMSYINSLHKPVHVYWVNVSLVSNPGYAAVNEAIALAQTRYSNLSVIDWATWADGHPWDLYDGVHPNTEGQAVRAAMIASAIPATP
jgi:lysophospholipase L1-like esterase